MLALLGTMLAAAHAWLSSKTARSTQNRKSNNQIFYPIHPRCSQFPLPRRIGCRP